LPLEIALQPDVVLAYKLWDEELPPQHGYPLRLVVPKRYAYKSAKWVKEIKFLERDMKGFWESRGYSNSADPFKEERYSTD
jgi:DMSO/TMAO reductase YedYZ molybdopterin-dependent catalytic subunit